jgi:putative FmdB family regulatory protein
VPLYEYECQGCHRRLEVIQKFSDPPKARCPNCGGRLKRLLSPPGIHFKGSGWYITDYARKGAGAAGAGADTASAPEGKAGDGPAGETKAGAGKAASNGSAPAARPARRPARRTPARRRRR